MSVGDDAFKAIVNFILGAVGALRWPVREVVQVGTELVVILRPVACPGVEEFQRLVHDLDVGIAGVDFGKVRRFTYY